MKRLFAAALLLSAISGFGLVGCGETSKVESTDKVETPTGSKTTTTETKVNTTGDATPGTPTAPAK